MVDQFGVDAVLDTGDITDWGSEPENRLITSVGTLDVPYVFIRGNHDSAATARLISEQPNATVLDGAATTVAGIDIVGVPDPRFTPDKSTGDDDAGDEVLVNSGEALAEVAEEQPERAGHRAWSTTRSGTAAGRRRPPGAGRAHPRPRRLHARGRHPAHGGGLHRRRRAARRCRASTPSR